MANIDSEEKERTLFCGNLHPKVTEEILYELFLQAGPLEKVKLIKNKNYAFITFKHSISVPYTIQLMNGIRLYQKPILLRTRTGTSNNSSQVPLTNVNMPFVHAPVPPPQFSRGSTFLQTPPTATNAVPNVANMPYHRSMSQPNFTLNRSPYNESHRHETEFVHNGKVKSVSQYQNHRANLPYSRISTPDSRFNQIYRNNSLTPILVPSPVHPHVNAMSSVGWQNLQLVAGRKF